MKKLILLLIILFQINTLVFAQGKTELLYVNGKYGTCEVMPYGICFQIKDAKSKVYKDWQNYPGEIRGLDYKEGFMYTISVKKIIHEVPPSEGVNYYYKLIKVIGKTPIKLTFEETLAKINNKIYYLRSYRDNNAFTKANKGSIKFNTSNKSYAGNDMCDYFYGEIKLITEKKLSLSENGIIKMDCPDLNNSNFKVKQLLSKVNGYSLKGDYLELLQGFTVLLKYQLDDSISVPGPTENPPIQDSPPKSMQDFPIEVK